MKSSSAHTPIEPLKPVCKWRFLIVDDEPLIVRIISGFLADVAMTLGKANSGEEALEIFAAEEFDVLITDRFMPGIDGIALVKHVKERRPELKTILISGVHTKPLTESGEEVSDLFLPKPFSKTDLLREVERLCAPPASVKN